jgi:hypothetical protein
MLKRPDVGSGLSLRKPRNDGPCPAVQRRIALAADESMPLAAMIDQ